MISGFVKFVFAAVLFQHVLFLSYAHGAGYSAYRSLGEGQLENGEYDDALLSLKRAYELNPNDAMTVDLIGMVYRKTGKVEKAAEQFKKAVMLDSKYYLGYYHLGGLYESVGRDWTDIIYMYRKALSLNADFVPARESIGRVFMKKGDYKNAIVHFEILSEIFPDKVEYFHKLGAALLNSGNAKKAVAVLKHISESGQSSPDLLNNIGVLYIELQNLDEAEVYLQRAVVLSPGFSEGMSNLGEVERLRGNLDGAIEYYKKAVKVNPEFSHGYFCLGRAYYLKNKMLADSGKSDYFQKSETAFKTALSIEQNDPEIYYFSGLNLFSGGKVSEAGVMFNKALDIGGEKIDYILALMKVSLSDGRMAEARDLLMRAEKLSHANYMSLNFYLVAGDFFADTGAYMKAKNYYSKALQINPHLVSAKKKIRAISGKGK